MPTLSDPKQNDELIEGYLDGLGDSRSELPESLANRSETYRHGWQNGRDDRLGWPRMSAEQIRQAGVIASLNDQSI